MDQPALPPTEPVAGADPLAWAQSVQQLRASGQINDAAYARYASGLEKAFSTAAPAATAQPLADAQRTARMEELRQLRMQGKCSDREWREFEALASGEQAAPSLTVDQQLGSQIDEIMAPARPQDYSFEYQPGFQHDADSVAIDSEIRSAFHTAGVPKHLGNAIFQAADRLSAELAGAPPHTLEARIAETTGALRTRWGDQFTTRRDACIEIIDAAAAHSAALGQMIDEAPWLLANEAIWLHLDTIAQHRSRRRA